MAERMQGYVSLGRRMADKSKPTARNRDHFASLPDVSSRQVPARDRRGGAARVVRFLANAALVKWGQTTAFCPTTPRGAEPKETPSCG